MSPERSPSLNPGNNSFYRADSLECMYLPLEQKMLFMKRLFLSFFAWRASWHLIIYEVWDWMNSRSGASSFSPRIFAESFCSLLPVTSRYVIQAPKIYHEEQPGPNPLSITSTFFYSITVLCRVVVGHNIWCPFVPSTHSLYFNFDMLTQRTVNVIR